jgi:hypothetical protein
MNMLFIDPFFLGNLLSNTYSVSLNAFFFNKGKFYYYSAGITLDISFWICGIIQKGKLDLHSLLGSTPAHLASSWAALFPFRRVQTT